MNSNDNGCNDDLGLTLGMLTLRLWLAVRAIQTGIEKFAGTREKSKLVEIEGETNPYGLTEIEITKSYSADSYSGVPEVLYKQFAAEPLIPVWSLGIYSAVLGPVLLILGCTLLLGLATRFTLFAMGLLYTSLSFGLILIKQDAGVAWLGIHVIMIVAALALAKHNRFVILKNC